MQARLVVVSGRDAGKIFFLASDNPNMLGRDKNCHICLNGRMISRRHCEIRQEGNMFFLIDLNSSNGTYVNDERTDNYLLKNGDLIQVGPIHLRFDFIKEEKSKSPLPQIADFEQPDENDSVELVDDDDEPLLSSSYFKKKFDIKEFSLGDEDDQIFAAQVEYNKLIKVCSLSGKLFSAKSVRKILGVALETAIELTGGERASALLYDKISGKFNSYATRFCDDHYCGSFPVSQTIIMETFRTAESVITGNACDDSRFADGDSVALDKICSVMCVPLVTLESEVLGALYIDCTSKIEAFSKIDLMIFAAVAHQAAISVERVKLFDDLEKLFIGSIHTLTASIEAKDEYTCGHSERVTCYAILIAEELGLDQNTRDLVEFAGIMHDVGKIGIPESVLCSTGKLTEEQYKLMQMHPVKGADIILKMPEIAKFASVTEVARAVRHHHERYDGTGYPDGLAGDEIPLVSKILSVADIFDAVTSDRSYRKGRNAKVAMKILSACSGIQVDPQIFAAFERVYAKGKINWLEDVNVRFDFNPQRLRANTVFEKRSERLFKKNL